MKFVDWRSLLIGAAGAVLIELLILVLLIWSGVFDIAASSGHSPIGQMFLSSTMERSVKARASGAAPALSAERIRAGGTEYKGMCEHCHGGPGVSRAEWAKGMTPRPPDLTQHSTKWTPEQIHWIVEHGVKMSGMPAFGGTHDSQTTWNITGFVGQLPSMSPEAYASVPAAEADHHAVGESQ
ncbi:cytochrome c [Brevundimonas sp.]|uniref:c-type cytochrome n=1 Tax=Brevundimonas sp. TaxID=1871086 RepID=UPI0025C33A53|nr:cytochrome c [Brevundimonas sp.]MCG2665277.1 cytochrome c [Brevundimonas sp.]